MSEPFELDSLNHATRYLIEHMTVGDQYDLTHSEAHKDKDIVVFSHSQPNLLIMVSVQYERDNVPVIFSSPNGHGVLGYTDYKGPIFAPRYASMVFKDVDEVLDFATTCLANSYAEYWGPNGSAGDDFEEEVDEEFEELDLLQKTLDFYTREDSDKSTVKVQRALKQRLEHLVELEESSMEEEPANLRELAENKRSKK